MTKHIGAGKLGPPGSMLTILCYIRLVSDHPNTNLQMHFWLTQLFIYLMMSYEHGLEFLICLGCLWAPSQWHRQ